MKSDSMEPIGQEDPVALPIVSFDVENVSWTLKKDGSEEMQYEVSNPKPTKPFFSDHMEKTISCDFQFSGKKQVNLDFWEERLLTWLSDAESIARCRLYGSDIDYPPIPEIVETYPIEDWARANGLFGEHLFSLDFRDGPRHIHVGKARMTGKQYMNDQLLSMTMAIDSIERDDNAGS